MKDLLKKPITFEKVEFWIATLIYVIVIFSLLGDVIQRDTYGYRIYTEYTNYFDRYNIPYSYTRFYFIPQLVRYTVYYTSYIVLSFFIIKPLVYGRRIALNIFLLLGMYALVASILGAADTWMKSYLFYKHSEAYVYNMLFRHEFVYTLWVLLIFGFYNILKQAYFSVKASLEETFLSFKQTTRECLIAIGIWLLSLFFLVLTHAYYQITMIWSEIVLTAIALYWYSFYKLIPDVLAVGRTVEAYLLKVIFILAISFFPVAFLSYVFFRHVEASIIINLFNIGTSLLIVVPLAWLLYKSRLNKNIELTGLKTALGRSSANLDFLRSQINPHFLFNALNTLYGTSLQENAERTGEGIQKLGDMMRFMLQENMQEKIALAREIDYLNNYIDLQKLRTQTSPEIIIQTEIDEQTNTLQIAPMLLIPFVENAFKHGISLREPSHIKISLQTRENELLFDVYNSIHPKAGNDPEKNKSGIGLENVKQRLLLLYPKRHELVIRESAKEFFIHLTVQL